MAAARTGAAWREIGMACLIGGLIGFVAAGERGAVHTERHTLSVRVDTLGIPRPVYLPVPGPGTHTSDTVYRDGKARTTVDRVTDTLYAGCDTATRYASEYADSNIRITVTSDVCGRLLSSRIAYEAYRRTVTVAPEPPRAALWLTAGSGPSAGLSFTRGRWMASYCYTPGTDPWRRHAVGVGFKLSFKKR